MPRGLVPRGQGSLEQERRWKQYLEDERIALFLQNEEFMKELQRNRDFLLALERGEEHRGKHLSVFWRTEVLLGGPGCWRGRDVQDVVRAVVAARPANTEQQGAVPLLLLVLSCPPRGSAPPAQQICGKEPWQCPPSPSQGDSQHGFIRAVPPLSPCTFPLPLTSSCCREGPLTVSTVGGQGNEHGAARAAQGSDQAGLGAFCFSDRLKYESKKSKSSSVAGSNDFGFSSILSGNFKRHKSITSRQLGASQLCPTAVLCCAMPCQAVPSAVAARGGTQLVPPCCTKPPECTGEGRAGDGDGCWCPPRPRPAFSRQHCSRVPALGAGMQLPGVTEPALALIGAEDCAWEA